MGERESSQESSKWEILNVEYRYNFSDKESVFWVWIKHLHGHDEYFQLRAKDELDAWEKGKRFIKANYDETQDSRHI